MSKTTQDHPWDLEERTAKFGEDVIRFAKTIGVSPVTKRLIDQVIGAATSVGANYVEADEAESKKEFRHRISICRREAKEAGHFLRMIAAADDSKAEAARLLWKESRELVLIFGKIGRAAQS